MKDYKGCDGCCIQDICTYTIESEACPCAICIIKMICVEACDERLTYRIKLEAKDDRN